MTIITQNYKMARALNKSDGIKVTEINIATKGTHIDKWVIKPYN